MSTTTPQAIQHIQYSNTMWQIYASFIILVSYTIAVCLRWGVPKSMSSTFFDIRRKWIFSAVIVVSFGLLAYPFERILFDDELWLGFLTIAGGWLIAFAPNLDDAMEERVHMTGAVVLAIASQLIVACINPHILGLWIAWLVSLPLKERVFWAEMIGGACLYASLLL